MSQLFSPIRIGQLDLPNRIVISPMCQYSAIHGDATDWHLVHLGQLAMSGASLLVLEATAVEERGRISHGDLGLYTEENEASLGRILTFCRRHGSAKLGIQLGHAGRKASAQVPWEGGRALAPGDDPWDTISASAVPFAEGWHTPEAATEADLDRIVEAFRTATLRAVRVGFEVIEVHAAHGYLLHQFLSPVSNHRTDQYGGSLENRMRFPLRVFEAVAGACPPEVAVGARITGSDWLEGGVTPEEAVAFGRELKARGCHYLDVTSGGIALGAKIELGPGYQVPFAHAVRQGVGLPVWSVGLIVTPEQAEQVVASGQADVVALARTMLDDPHWPWAAAHALGGEVKRPPQYERAAPEALAGRRLQERAVTGPSRGRIGEDDMTDVFICDAVRTPIGRYGGGLAPVRTDDLAAIPIRELLRRHPGLAGHVDEVVLGCANQAGEDNRNVARMATLLAGLPEATPAATLNRLCASGLDAVGAAARAIKAGEADLVIAGGVESMTRAPFVMGKAETAFQRAADIHDTTIGWRFINPLLKAQYGVDSMPDTAENVAEEFQVGRQDQDAFALRSQQRAGAAQAAGRLGEGIVAVEIAGRKGQTVRIEHDEHLRPDTTAETLAKLKPIRAGGSVTAGNASGVNDGAAAIILASAAAAERHGLTPRVRVLGLASAGVAPRIMGIGPVPATTKLLERLGLKISDLDVIELNEAFASQVLASLRQLGVPDDAEHVNPNGGGIALGHPLGMSGARIAMDVAAELGRRGGRYGLATMCVGVGQGVAMALERVG